MEARVARVVVGVGDSLASLEALRYAVSEARRRGALLVAVRAWLSKAHGLAKTWANGASKPAQRRCDHEAVLRTGDGRSPT